MGPFIAAFRSELLKTAGVGNLVERLKHSPDLRRAILKSTVLGAGTALAGTALQSNENRKKSKPWLRNAVTGGATGAITGAAFPGWFDHKSHLATDELAAMKKR